MTEKLTMKKLSNELEQLRAQMHEMEAQLRHHLEDKPKSALTASKSATRPAGKSAPLTTIDAEQRQQLITTEAYLIAEQRGFQGGNPSQDWAEAERLVDYRLMQAGESGQAATDTARPRKKKTRAAKSTGGRKNTGVKTAAAAKP